MAYAAQKDSAWSVFFGIIIGTIAAFGAYTIAEMLLRKPMDVSVSASVTNQELLKNITALENKSGISQSEVEEVKAQAKKIINNQEESGTKSFDLERSYKKLVIDYNIARSQSIVYFLMALVLISLVVSWWYNINTGLLAFGITSLILAYWSATLQFNIANSLYNILFGSAALLLIYMSYMFHARMYTHIQFYSLKSFLLNIAVVLSLIFAVFLTSSSLTGYTQDPYMQLGAKKTQEDYKQHKIDQLHNFHRILLLASAFSLLIALGSYKSLFNLAFVVCAFIFNSFIALNADFSVRIFIAAQALTALLIIILIYWLIRNCRA